MAQIDDREAYLIHVAGSSDSDSDVDGKIDFDEEYKLLKPPPLLLDEDQIVVIPSGEVPEVNFWEERLKMAQNNNENGLVQDEIDVEPVTKKKRKRSNKNEKLKVVDVNKNETDEIALFDASSETSCSGNSSAENNPTKISYDCETLLNLRQNVILGSTTITEQINVWLSKENDEIPGCFISENSSPGNENKLKQKKKKKPSTKETNEKNTQMEAVEENKLKKKEKQLTEETNENNTEEPKKELDSTVSQSEKVADIQNEAVPTTSQQCEQVAETQIESVPTTSQGKKSYLEQFEEIFGSDFKDFMQSMIGNGISIEDLRSFKYEQLYSAYTAYRQKVATESQRPKVPLNPPRPNVPVQQIYPGWTYQQYQNYQRAYPRLQPTNLSPNMMPYNQNNLNWVAFTGGNPTTNLAFMFYPTSNTNPVNVAPATEPLKLTEIVKEPPKQSMWETETCGGPSEKQTSPKKQELVDCATLENNIKNSTQQIITENDGSSITTKSEIKKLVDIFHNALQAFRDGESLIVKAREITKYSNLPFYSQFHKHIKNLLRINESAGSVIHECIKICIDITKPRNVTDSTVEHIKKWVANFQKYKMWLEVCNQDVLNCEMDFLMKYTKTYTNMLKNLVMTLAGIVQCVNACQNIDKELKKLGLIEKDENEVPTQNQVGSFEPGVQTIERSVQTLEEPISNRDEQLFRCLETPNNDLRPRSVRETAAEDTKVSRCELNLDDIFFNSGFLDKAIQAFKDGQYIIVKAREMAKYSNLAPYADVHEFIEDFLKINKAADSVIMQCIQTCTYICNQRNSNGSTIENIIKKFAPKFQLYSEQLQQFNEEALSCEMDFLMKYKKTYNNMIKHLIMARGGLVKCINWCEDINKEIENTGLIEKDEKQIPIQNRDAFFVPRVQTIERSVQTLEEPISNRDGQLFRCLETSNNDLRPKNVGEMAAEDTKVSPCKPNITKEVLGEDITSGSSVWQHIYQSVSPKFAQLLLYHGQGLISENFWFHATILALAAYLVAEGIRSVSSFFVDHILLIYGLFCIYVFLINKK